MKPDAAPPSPKPAAAPKAPVKPTAKAAPAKPTAKPAKPEPKTAAQVQAFASKIKEHLDAGTLTAAQVPKIAAALSELTVAQLGVVKKHLGLKVGGAQAAMAKGIAEKALAVQKAGQDKAAKAKAKEELKAAKDAAKAAAAKEKADAKAAKDKAKADAAKAKPVKKPAPKPAAKKTAAKPKATEPVPEPKPAALPAPVAAAKTVAQAQADLAALPPLKKNDGSTDPARVKAPMPSDSEAFSPEDEDAISAKLKAGKFSKQDVDLADLTLFQRYVYPDAVKKYLDNPASTDQSGQRVVVVRSGGKQYVFDGTHRTVAAKLRGVQKIPANVVDLDEVAAKADTAAAQPAPKPAAKPKPAKAAPTPKPTVTVGPLPNQGSKPDNVPNKHLSDESRPHLSATEAKAVQEYSSSAFEPLNQALRGGGDLPANELRLRRVQEGLQAAFTRARPLAAPVQVARGMNLGAAPLHEFATRMEDALKTGAAVKVGGYTSTSTGGIKPDFAGNVEVHITAKRGLDLGPYSYNPEEKELLLDHNSEFKPTKVERVGGKLIVHMEQV